MTSRIGCKLSWRDFGSRDTKTAGTRRPDKFFYPSDFAKRLGA